MPSISGRLIVSARAADAAKMPAGLKHFADEIEGVTSC